MHTHKQKAKLLLPCYIAYFIQSQMYNTQKQNRINLLKPTGYIMHQQVKHSRTTCSPHTVFTVCIYLRTNSDLCHLHHNLIGFIIRMKSVFCAVQTGSLTLRHRASCILGQAFHYSPENAFYIFHQQIYFIIWYLLDRASLI